MLARFALIAVLLAAFALRLTEARRGLPYLYPHDEPQIVNAALGMMRTGDFNPHFFNYGSLLIYQNLAVDILHYFYLVTRPDGISGLEEIITGYDASFKWTISHPGFYLWNRAIIALLGTATVWLVYLIARRLAGRWPAVAGAALLAITPAHIGYSAIIGNDAVATFAMALLVYVCILYADGGAIKHLLTAGLVVGLATATKYNAAVLMLLPWLVLLWRRERNPWLYLAMPTVAGVAFLVATPYALLDLPTFLQDAGFEARHYTVIGHGQYSIWSRKAQLWLQLGHIADNIGWHAFALSAIGALAILARLRYAWLVVFPVLLALIMSNIRVDFHRNWIIFYPLACVCFGAALGEFVRITERKPLWRYDRLAQAMLCVAVVAILAAQAAIPLRTVPTALQPDSRTAAMMALAELDTPGPVGIAQELRIHPEDLRRLAVPYEVAPVSAILTNTTYTAIVIPRRSKMRYQKNKPIADSINGADPHGQMVGEFGTGIMWVDDMPSVNPRVEIWVLP